MVSIYKFTFKAYSEVTFEGNIVNPIEVIVIAKSVKDAIEKAVNISECRCTDIISIKEVDDK